ncbi:gliding motility-associated ABC transporter permease subunit GldF [Luteibaculum oceani]|uniref:Gliding motility-associated ABC transporter permease subunit GldF n=1 Tax=Luteibaculum oceani TaxID=1294296 RepID=A0A5C6VAT0_9FLAO|nr:gliding motility-associated ABC transporter permease subunit GldF [Luteibaculum oceani]TXC81970.1 gliding motility-associated ABC transporter permease subunit GldF [Luteibaculum oceani]
MFPLFKKELRTFLSSVIGFIVLSVFLVLTALFNWVFLGDLNIINSGYADYRPFFVIAPWMFLFLIPAITMRFFSEEKRTGTIELLLTKPISELQIVMGKFLAGVVLVICALLPTLVFYFSLSSLAIPEGNVDNGAILGSYIGLLFLASSFVAIGTFASSLSDSQIISFLIAVFLCFFCYTGFGSIASFKWFGALDSVILNLGMEIHYESISKGVIDTRDVVYFFSVSFIFIMLTRFVLEGRKW